MGVGFFLRMAIKVGAAVGASVGTAAGIAAGGGIAALGIGAIIAAKKFASATQKR